jgi:hypothetical protein
VRSTSASVRGVVSRSPRFKWQERRRYQRSAPAITGCPDPAIDLCGATVARSKARPLVFRGRGTGRFFAPSSGKKTGPTFCTGPAAVTHAGPHGGTLTAGLKPRRPSPSLKSIYKIFWLDVCAGGYVGKGEHFPVFAQQNGGSAAGRLKADCPHIHGCQARVLYRARLLCTPWRVSGGRVWMNVWRMFGILGTVIHRGKQELRC